MWRVTTAMPTQGRQDLPPMPRYGGDKERGTQTTRRRAQNAPAKSCAPNSPQAAGSIPPKLSDQFPPTVRFDLDTCGSMWHVFCLITVSGLTKGIIFGHEYGIWLASSQRVLADSEMDP